ncbi:hypothetical protein [Olsenella intestinalis]|uniref:hypothetical protein n=1 Tax=Olsenella intestinalis TaxID=2930083 RepID=UPI00200DD75F|nr:hypothetical protein [Olsenella intestinalis]
MPKANSETDFRVMMENDDVDHVIGDPSDFAIGYRFIGDDRFTVLSMYARDRNLLGFTEEGEHCTTRWAYLEGLVAWLKSFADNMVNDPYPLEVEGEFAAQKDDAAREFDSKDMKAFDAYFDLINTWAWNHTWSHESGGAVLSHMYFEYKAGMVELSWDNRDDDSHYVFDCECGGTRVEAKTFRAVVLEFVDAYERHWGIKVDDDGTWLRKSRA